MALAPAPFVLPPGELDGPAVGHPLVDVPRHSQANAIRFFDYGVGRFPFRINTIRTDRGHEWQALFHWHVEGQGARHVYIKPRSPQLNGKVERSHRTDQEEFYQLLTYKDDVDLEKKLASRGQAYHPRHERVAQRGRSPQRNASSYVARKEQRAQVAADIRAIFNAPTRVHADEMLRQATTKYRKTAPKLATWMEENIPEGLTVLDEKLDLTDLARRRLRTTNGLERVNKEIKRRTSVATLFPNEESVLRLVSALLMEISEEWETGRIYLASKDGDSA